MMDISPALILMSIGSSSMQKLTDRCKLRGCLHEHTVAARNCEFEWFGSCIRPGFANENRTARFKSYCDGQEQEHGR